MGTRQDAVGGQPPTLSPLPGLHNSIRCCQGRARTRAAAEKEPCTHAATALLCGTASCATQQNAAAAYNTTLMAQARREPLNPHTGALTATHRNSNLPCPGALHLQGSGGKSQAHRGARGSVSACMCGHMCGRKNARAHVRTQALAQLLSSSRGSHGSLT